MGKVVHGCLPRKKKGGPSGKSTPGKGKGKKNAGVGVDFKRVKHKVGKKLPKAQNETDASFKSHTINLPSQTVQQDKLGVAVNFQNLSLQELLNQTSHYSEKARKQSLAGLSDLFTRHPEELKQHMHLFFTKVVERVGDGDADVRATLRSLMRDKVMPLLQPGTVRPFMPIVMAHVSSAMTNLNMAVRLDALNFIDILMDFVPELVVGGFLAPCLLHFCDLLSQAHRGRNIKSQSISSLLKVVTSINSFLKRAENGANGAPSSTVSDPSAAKAPGPSPTLASHVLSQSSFTTLMSDRITWPTRKPFLPVFIEMIRSGSTKRAATGIPEVVDANPGAPLSKRALHELERGVAKPKGKWSVSSKPAGPTTVAKVAAAAAAAASGTAVSTADAVDSENGPVMTAATVSDVSGLTRRLIALLFDCWAECGPSKVVGNGLATATENGGSSSNGGKSLELESLNVLSGILSAAFSLLTRLLLLSREDEGDLEQGPRLSAGESFREIETLAWASDLIIRRVSSHFPATVPSVKPSPVVAEALVQYNLQASQLLSRLLPVSSSVSLMGQGLGAQQQQTWVHALITFYSGVMQRGELVPERGMLSEASAVAGTATNAAYLAVLRGVDSACRARGVVGDVGCLKQLTLAVEQLAGRMSSRSPVRVACLKLQHGLMTAFRKGEVLLDEDQISGWLKPLPKLIWELSDLSPDTTAIALRMLLDAARFTPCRSPDQVSEGMKSPAGIAHNSSLRVALDQLQRQLAPLFCISLPQLQQQRKSLPALTVPSLASNSGSTIQQTVCPLCDQLRVEAAQAAERAMTSKQDGAPEGSGAEVLLTASPTPGPLSKLPLAVQLLAVDLMYHLSPSDAGLLKALATAVLDPTVIPPDEVALRLAEVMLMRLPSMKLSSAVSWVFTLLFWPASKELDVHHSVPSEKLFPSWDRQKSIVERTCQSLPAWLPVTEVLRLFEPQLQTILKDRAVGLTNHQRYSLVQLVIAVSHATTGEATSPPSYAIEQNAIAAPSGTDCVPLVVLSALPEVCLDLFRSQHGPTVWNSREGASTDSAGAKVDAVLLQLLQSQSQSQVLLPLIRYCAAAALGRQSPHHTNMKGGSLGKAEVSGDRNLPSSAIGHNVDCIRSSFLSSAALMLLMLRSRPLQAALLCHKDEVIGVVHGLVNLGRSHGGLVGEGDCKVSCTQLEQAIKDIF